MNLLPQLGSPWTTFKGMKVAFGIRSNSSASIILFVTFFEKASCKTPCEHPRVLHSKEEGKSFSADNRNSQWGSCFFAVASSSTFFYSNAFFESTKLQFVKQPFEVVFFFKVFWITCCTHLKKTSKRDQYTKRRVPHARESGSRRI